MQKSKEKQKKLKRKKRLDRLYDKKPFIEFVVALLSIPSLILILILNYNSIKNLNATRPTPTPVSGSGIMSNGAGTNANFFAEPLARSPRPTNATSDSQGCNKSLGPVTITSPSEGQVVSTNPVEVDISYDDSTYCSAVWSYSVNGSNWSSYDNNSVALYNLPNGPVKFELQVKSLTSSNTTTITRNFTYNGQSTIVTPPSASSSAQ